MYHQLSASPDAACPGLMAIRGKRLVVTDEIPASQKLEESVVKQFTGGSEVTGRALYGAEQSFRPQALFILSCNEIPEFKGVDGGLKRRLRIIPFDLQFVDEPTMPFHRLKDASLESKTGSARWAQALIQILLDRFPGVMGMSDIPTPVRVT